MAIEVDVEALERNIDAAERAYGPEAICAGTPAQLRALLARLHAAEAERDAALDKLRVAHEHIDALGDANVAHLRAEQGGVMYFGGGVMYRSLTSGACTEDVVAETAALRAVAEAARALRNDFLRIDHETPAAAFNSLWVRIDHALAALDAVKGKP